jgi:hypothetical protein
MKKLVLTNKQIEKFRNDGLLIVKILTSEQAAQYALYAKEFFMGDFIANTMNVVQFLQPKTSIYRIHSLVVNLKIEQVVMQLLNTNSVILDGASLFYSKQYACYKQGWHRDILQLPENEIDTKWFNRDYFYNNIQINVALNDDNCFHYIIGSHLRKVNLNESIVFGGNKKMSSACDIQLGKMIRLKAGQAVFYNNLGIHRGYNPCIDPERATVQIGFHSIKAKPTWHFGVINYKEFDVDYLKSLDTKVSNLLWKHIEERKRFPFVDSYYQQHQDFLNSEFPTT